MPASSSSSRRLEKLFARRKCWMLAQLAASLDCALITVRRLLSRIGYHRSYTDNGKWYTSADSPAFDPQGLWRHRGIGFSKHGSLTATIAELVARAPVGLSARELEQTLHHPCQAVLSQLHRQGKLDRVKSEGQFRYLSRQEAINRRQRQGAGLEAAPDPSGPLSTQAAVRVLVAYIKEPAESFERIAQRVRGQGQAGVSAESIEGFFAEHGLKKTLPTSKRRR
jgi:hypothetical protein